MDTPLPAATHPGPRFGARRSATFRLRDRLSRGFTIAEVMVATFVMAFAISSSILVMQSGFRALDTARKTTLASQIMQSEMERMRMLSWSRVQALISSTATPIDIDSIFPKNTDAEKRILAEMKRNFTSVRTAGYVAGSGDQMIEIAITITWKGIDLTSHKRTSSTRYCKNGLYNYYYTLNKSSS